MTYHTIACVADNTEEATNAKQALGLPSVEEVETPDVIIALGGDGFMLHTIHKYLDTNIPIYGMNCGTVGFLMNTYNEEQLKERLQDAEKVILHPLQMTATTVTGEIKKEVAFNEVSLLRETYQTAHIEIAIDGITRIPELVCDGVLVATAAGSTAYNLSAGGPVVPLGAQSLALTPISPFRPRRWKGALLPNNANITLTIKNPNKRPVSAVADSHEVRDVAVVEIKERSDQAINVLFDPDHSLEDRIIKEQFEL